MRKKRNTFEITQFMLIIFGIFFMGSTVSAELTLKAVYPTLGVLGQPLDVMLTGEGFDENTNILISPEIGNGGMVTDAADTPGFAYDVAVAGNTGYVADGSSGLQIIALSDSASPAVIKSVNLPDKAYGVAVSGNIAYVANGSGGLVVTDIETPSDAVVIASQDTPEFAQGVAVKDDIAFVADWNNGLHLIDISTPSAPVLIKSVNTPGRAMNVTVAGDFAYVADEHSGLQIVDISTPSEAEVIGELDTPGSAFGISVVGDVAYVADGSSGLQVADISIPSYPVLMSTADTPGSASDVAVIGNIAYVADGESGLRMLDVSNPSNPRLIRSADTSDSAQGVTVIEDMAYVADGSDGLLIVPAPLEIKPVVNSEKSISLTLPGPKTAGHYTLKVFNGQESRELSGAVTFISPEHSDILRSKAIIVAGGGDYSQNDLWEPANMCAIHAYNALLRQGYFKENIYYLSPDMTTDADEDGIPDVDAEATAENLSDAITTWAADASGSQVLLYMTGNAFGSEFILDGIRNPMEKITAEELDNWLDDLQMTMTGNLIFIYDAPGPKHFLDRMMPPEGKERVVINSASPNEDTYFKVNGTLSFSYIFWSSVFENAGLGNAFETASRIMEYYQEPLVDADGNGIGNEEADNHLSKDIVIGRGYVANSELPGIQEVSDDFILNGETSAILRADGVTASNDISSVLAVIIPPGGISETSEVLLQGPDANGDYKTNYEDFTRQGLYKIQFYARDARGFYSLPGQTKVIQTNGNPALKGDLTGDWTVDLIDAIIALKILAGADVSDAVWAGYSILTADVNGDERVGFEEFLYILEQMNRVDEVG
ncbi:hypothetical protein [Desulfonema magnum]|uniref:LVIVD repeat-containing protein n=1 Tax=Desulfonema magnum TaxID=45655 RepID=A0A975BRI9_9BACT|nr:hypothetical protein [Desulfonema magnum]QTA89904.1 LVIVD repeat-containing protein [Desulfonema magnum]